MEFDELRSGLIGMSRDDEHSISMELDETNIDFPEYTYEKLPRKRGKAKAKTVSAEKVGSAEETGVSEPVETVPSKGKAKEIKIDSIKTLTTTDKNKKSGVGVISITGGKESDTSIVGLVAKKHKEELDKRNKELLRVRAHPYIRREFLLTNAEKKLYKFLRQRLADNIVIFSKVRLADIVELNEAVTRDSQAFRKIAYKHVDFVIMSPELDIICVVELDDYTHNTPKAEQRDNFVMQVMRECGVPYFRVKCKIDLIKPSDIQFIEGCVLEYMAPVCEKCGRPMEFKICRKAFNYGHRFYGCLGFYESGPNHCDFTINID